MPIKKLTFRKLFSPYFLDEYSIYKSIKKNAHFLDGKILDIWCREKPYKSFFKYSHYIGLDIIAWKNVDILADATNIPLEKESIDSIFSTQVITDIYMIEKFFWEISRILKKNGKIFFTTEFICWKNDEPHDYYRFTDNYLKKKLLEYNFRDISIIPTSNNFYSSGYVFSLSFWKVYLHFKNNIFGKILFPFIVLIIFFINVKSLLFSLIFPKDYSLTLWYTVLAVK